MSEQRRDAITAVATPGTINLLAAGEVFGEVVFTGANAVGPQLVITLPNVMFRPNNRIGFIQDEWGQLQVTGEVLADSTGVFGTIAVPDTTLVSPLTSLYYIGKGVVTVKVPPAATARDIGNVPVFEFEPNITVLDHFSSRVGIRSKDLSVIREKAATLQMTMDEFGYDNLMLALLGVAGP
jgi:hypothetical protein